MTTATAVAPTTGAAVGAGWHTAPMPHAVRAVVQVIAVLDQAAGGVRAATRGWSGAWSGEAAGAAAARCVALALEVDEVASVLRLLVPALTAAEQQLTLLESVRHLAALAALTDAALADAGPSGGTWSPDTPQRAGSPAVERLAAELDADLSRSLAAAGEALSSLRRRRTTGAGRVTPAVTTVALLTRAGPPLGDVHRWWDALPPGARVAAVDAYPEWVGPTDGLPAWARDRANRVLLDRTEAQLRTAVATGPGSPSRDADRQASQHAVAALAALAAVRRVLDQPDGRTRQLLLLDPSGRSPRVAVAVGDVDRAHHVAVLVPGFTTTVARDLDGSDRLAADLADEAHHAATLVGDDRGVAVVSWLGYDVPQVADTLDPAHSVASRASAQQGADALAGFLGGLPVGGHLTLVGHSYGSTTAGLAATHDGTGVDDLVVLGSPGLGVATTAALRVPPGRVHVVEARDDPVAQLGWFGRDPGELPGVDLLSSEPSPLPDGAAGALSTGHSQYLAPGTTSQWNVAAVVAGAPTVRRGSRPGSW